jgi:hypothetical protein
MGKDPVSCDEYRWDVVTAPRYERGSFCRDASKERGRRRDFRALESTAIDDSGVLQIKDLLLPNLTKLSAADTIEVLDDMVDSGHPQNTNAGSIRQLKEWKSASSAIGTTESRVSVGRSIGSYAAS